MKINEILKTLEQEAGKRLLNIPKTKQQLQEAILNVLKKESEEGWDYVNSLQPDSQEYLDGYIKADYCSYVIDECTRSIKKLFNA